MEIIDIRKYCEENFELITVYDNKIYYCKADNLHNNYIVDFYCYDIKEMREHKITNKSLNTPEFYNKRVYRCDNCILFSIVNNDNVEIFKLDLNTNKIQKISTVKVNEEFFSGISFLGENYFILHVNESDVDNENYDAKKDIQGGYESAYLYDIYTGEKYEILDKRIVWGVRDYLEYYKYNEEEFLMFEEAYIEDWEQEELYYKNLEKTDYYRESYRESINIIKLNDFVQEIKNGNAMLAFHQVSKTEVNGWTRYFGMDENNIYYRWKNFKTNIETIWSVDKNSLKQKKLGDIDFDELKDKEIRYDMENQKIYSEYSIENQIQVSGVYNGDTEIQFPRSIGDFDTIVNDEYLFTYYWEEDEEDNYYDYMVIKNLISEEEKLYQGVCRIIDNLVVIYS